MAFISKTADKLNGLDAESVVALISKTIGVDIPFPMLTDEGRVAYITRVGKDQSVMVTIPEKAQLDLGDGTTADFSDTPKYPISSAKARSIFKELTSMDIPDLRRSGVRFGFDDYGAATVNWTETIEEDDIVRDKDGIRLKTSEEVESDLQTQIQVSEQKAQEAKASREKLAASKANIEALKKQSTAASAKRSQEESKLQKERK